jgi:hypothetical protein
MRTVLLLLGSASLLALSTPITAQSVQRPAPGGLGDAPGAHFVIEAAFEGGGDRILEVIFTDGSTQDVYAGQGGTFAAGVEFRPARLPRLALGATLGYKFVTTAADNADITFTRIPIEVVGRWSLANGWWLGAGVVHHASIEFDGDGFAPNASLPGASGLTAELGWKWFALTYTNITYDDAGNDLDAGSVGASLRWVFGASR